MGFHSNLEPVYDSSLEPVNVTHIATAMSILARLGVPYSIQTQTQSRDEVSRQFSCTKRAISEAEMES